jgi:hypothetical protein
MIAKIAIDHRNHHFIAEGRLGAGEARFDLAVVGATVAISVVAVVTLFAEDDAVAALGRARGAAAVGLVLAILGTAIEGHGVAVVAALRAFDLPVSAGGVGANARAVGCAAAALVTKLDLAGGRAAVAGSRVSVITLLGRDKDSVAATGDAVTELPGRDAGVARLNPQTVGGTAIAGDSVAVIAGLVFGQSAVTTARWGRQVGSVVGLA